MSDLVQVPAEPTEAMWSGFARDVIQFLYLNSRPTGEKFHDFMKAMGHVPVPEYARREIPRTNHVPAKGDFVVVIYKAMLEAHRIEQQGASSE